MAEINMIRVGAIPSFLHLRPGLDINRSRRRPFTTAIMLSWYKNVSVEKLAKMSKHLEEILRFWSRRLAGWAGDFRTWDAGAGSGISERWVWIFRIERPQISEQNGFGVGSRFSELGKWKLMVGLGKEDEN